jgi:AraC family carnitine catabolism transcriptional activator
VNISPSKSISFGLVLLPSFSQLGVYSIIEPMRAANHWHDEGFEWRLLSIDGQPVTASNGENVKVCSAIDASVRFDFVALVCGDSPLEHNDPAYARFLRACRRHGAKIGAFDVAQFILAEAGFLNDKASTVHWEYADAFREKYPRVEVHKTLFEWDGDVFTSAGATAGLDFMLDVIRSEMGDELASRIASRFLIKEIRTAKDSQALKDTDRYGTHDPRMIRALKLMEEHMADKLPIDQIAERSRISQRSLERAFNKKFGVSPSKYYWVLRLERAHEYLTKTDLSVSEISLLCGFNSQTQFGRAFRQHFQTTPTVARKTGTADPSGGTQPKID